ncbi:MAG TPA: cellulase [Xanthomonadaceae bacterium]|nr:cellulase [Xanthomonadaceae bacterium]
MSSISPGLQRLRPLALTLALLALAPLAQAADVLKYAGVNLAGAEFNSSKRPGTLFKDYTYPAASDYSYFAGQGMNIVRLPFLWERLQPQARGELDAAQLELLKKAVAQAKANGLHLILDVHNYAKYNGTRLDQLDGGSAALADLWTRLAREFGNDRAVIFGLMNEPNGISATDWAAVAQASINAIRATGASNLILVPGTAYTGAHNWVSGGYGATTNAQAQDDLHDPLNHYAIELHQYLDANYSGTSGECASTTIGVDKLRGVTAWLRQQGRQGFLGEFGAGDNDTCRQALDGLLGFLQDNRDVWLGWTYWAAGAWWKADYPFNVQPGKDGSAKPQMSILSRYAKQITEP